ncbi:MAG: flavodoxin family protein [Candidatus Verstraetearchaeota archaeon]|nr:flavodoxin family protein [Candidatus Verstraetearchaeota archaeon]
MTGKKPLVLIITGSPRRYGSSTQLAHVAMKGVEDAGGRAEVLYLYDYDIKPCIGCASDNVKYCKFPCVVDDDFNEIGEKIVESDGIILVTPVYWYAPSGVLKNLVDRLTSMENMISHGGRSLLEGKVAGFIATGLDSGTSMAIAYLMFVLNSMGVVIAPWSMAYSHMEDVAKDEKALRDAYNVGYLVVETIKAVKNYGKHIGYNNDADVKELAEIAKRVAREGDKVGRLEGLARIAILKPNPSPRSC